MKNLMEDSTVENTLLKTGGMLGVALLALTACQGTPADDQVEEDPGQENIDPDGAEDQGDEPDEIADEEPTEAPELAEIENAVWESSRAAENVTIVTSQADPEDLGEEDDDADDADDDADADDEADLDEEDVADEGGEAVDEDGELTIFGTLDGEAWGFSSSAVENYETIVVEGVVYQTVDAVVADFEAEVPEGVEPEVQPEELRDALEAEGQWVELQDTEMAVAEAPGDFIESFREGIEEGSGGQTLADWNAPGETEERDGQEVWVYADDQLEVVVQADESEPRLLEVTLTDAQQVQLTDWDETEVPEVPAEDELITAEDLERIITELL